MNCARREIAWSLAPLMALFMGCGGAIPNVQGNITWNGKPVENGAIRFIHQLGENKGPGNEAIFMIENGNYSSDPGNVPMSGINRIEIRAQMDTGKTKTVPKPEARLGSGEMITVPITRQFIPDEYNSESTLTREIKPGRNNLNFELTGQEIPETASR